MTQGIASGRHAHWLLRDTLRRGRAMLRRGRAMLRRRVDFLVLGIRKAWKHTGILCVFLSTIFAFELVECLRSAKSQKMMIPIPIIQNDPFSLCLQGLLMCKSQDSTEKSK